MWLEVGPGRFGAAVIVYAAGGVHSGVMTSCGVVWTLAAGRKVAWRKTSWRQGSSKGSLAEPVPSAGCQGSAHLVPTTCGAVWGCGFGAHRHLGLIDMDDRHAPVRVGGEEAFGQSKVHMVE